MNTPRDASSTTPVRRSRVTRVLTTCAIGVAVGLLVSGCVAGPSASSTPAAPTEPAKPSTSTPTSAPSATGTPTPSAAPLPTSDDFHPVENDLTGPLPSAGGCPANDATIPEGANVSAIEDVDGDGIPDTQFFSENPEFVYGISTASGATFSIPSGMAGPGKHSGWTALLESRVALTVLDDSRGARVHAFVDCAFVTPVDAAGNPLSPHLREPGDTYTGLQCSSGNGGRWFYGMHLAPRTADGRSTITRTSLYVTADGVHLTVGAEEPVAADIPGDDPRVSLATQSTCEDVPKVSTSGR